ncbi:MAG TPA: hypothetical protein VLJ14_18405 [Ktedonobacterales bacterium]|nr:hypothetical protein [Ktedonobacterales bacterium]
MFKYTFLSKWTVLILTVITFALAFLAINQFTATPNHPFRGVLILVLGFLLYAVAWIVALLDSIQEKKFAWSVGLILLLPFGIGPLLYSLIGPRNTK